MEWIVLNVQLILVNKKYVSGDLYEHVVHDLAVHVMPISHYLLEHLEHMIVSIIMGASATGISEGTLNTIISTAWYVKILFRTNSTVLSVFCRWFVYDYHYLNLVSIYSLRHFPVARINIGY